MAINYNYDSKNETAEQYHARIAKARGELSGDNATKSESTVNPAEGMTNFNIGINKAIDEGRKMRQDKTLDFMNGVVPPGALPASSFASVLKQFNSSSAPMEATLMEGAMDFAAEQEKIKVDTQNSIRQLALDVGKNGGSQDMVNAISALVESGDIDSALKIGATALSKGNEDIRQVGSNLVKVDKDGNVKVLYSAPSTAGGGSEAGTGFFNSGGLRIDKADLGTGSQELAATRGVDGFVNTDKYSQMYQHWVDNGGLPQDFFNQYDPDFYLNPDDASIPSYIKSQMKKEEEDTNPFN